MGYCSHIRSNGCLCRTSLLWLVKTIWKFEAINSEFYNIYSFFPNWFMLFVLVHVLNLSIYLLIYF